MLAISHALAAMEVVDVDRHELDLDLGSSGYFLKLKVQLEAVPVSRLQSTVTHDATQLVENLQRIVNAVQVTQGD